ncbi:MAG: hypothetical protein JST78_00285 [Bacteroidetes bacterium]|nr:hypothetical protein [Bacteroidota bacterium]
MPLNKSYRDEQQEKIQQTLQQLLGLSYVPEQFEVMDRLLESLGMNLRDLSQKTTDDWLLQTEALALDAVNAELLADVMAHLSQKDKARALYDQIQNNSKVYSWSIAQKRTQL